MKKILFAALAALTITSCSQNEEIEAPSQKAEIKFTPVVNKASRAATILLNKDFTEFTAYAYAYTEGSFLTTAKTFFGPETFKKGDPTWTASKTFYWPATDKVSFFAYGGATDVTYGNLTSSAYPTLGYTVKEYANGQEDLVIAKAENEDSKTPTVALSFTHALTQVVFQCNGERDDIKYDVTSIVVTDTKTTGTYAYDNSTWTIAQDSPTTSSTITLNSFNFKGGATDPTSLPDGNELILMPQATDGITVEVTYTATQVDASDKVISTLFDGKKTVNLPKTTWGAGQKMVYTLKLTPGTTMGVTGELSDTWNSGTGEVEVK